MNTETRKKRRNSVIVFFLMMIVGAFIGIGISIFITRTGGTLVELGMWLEETILSCSVFLFPICGFLSITTSHFLYRKAKGIYLADEDDMNAYKKANEILDIAMSISSLANIIMFTLFAFVNTYFLKSSNLTLVFIYIGIFLFFNITFSFQKRVFVDFVKRMNPTKQGDALDNNFFKEWMDSCDEYELTMIYKAAYQSYIVTNKAFGYAMFLTLIIQLYFGIGIFPVLLVAVLWFIQVFSYLIAVRKLEHK